MILSSVTLAPNLLAVVDETGGLSGVGLSDVWPRAGATSVANTATTSAVRATGCPGSEARRRRNGYGMAILEVVSGSDPAGHPTKGPLQGSAPTPCALALQPKH